MSRLVNRGFSNASFNILKPMKNKHLLTSILFSVLALNAFAQKGVDDGSVFGHGEDSVRCINNLSIYMPYAKQGDYASALEFWEIAYNECPASRISLYIDGAKIRAWQIESETDPAKKVEYLDKLMQVYDQRIQYFGNTKRYPKEAWILGRKALDFIKYASDDADLSGPHSWLEKSLKDPESTGEPVYALAFMDVSIKQLRKDTSLIESFVNDYLLASKVLDVAMSEAKDSAEIKKVENYRNSVDVIFLNSGVADCSMMERMFGGTRMEENKENISFLKGVVSVMKRIKCTDTELYFQASNYVHTIQPTSESAEGLAYQAIKKEDYTTAASFLQEALSMEKDNMKKADLEYLTATVLFAARNKSDARTHALRAAELNPSSGMPYILIAKMYASSTNIYAGDPVLERSVYWVAVDKLVKARSVDASVAEEANSLISSYSAQFPRKEDVFMHPQVKEGQYFTVGGWIGERTICR